MTPQEALFQKDLASLKARLQDEAHPCPLSLEALTFAQKHHPGHRRDGITPNFHHQVIVASGIHAALIREPVLVEQFGLDIDVVTAGGVLHDTPEEHQEIKRKTYEKKFGAEVTETAFQMSKINSAGQVIPALEYFKRLREDARLAVIKPHDVDHNARTLLFLSPARAAAYFSEKMTYFQSVYVDNNNAHLRLLIESQIVQVPMQRIGDSLKACRMLMQYVSNHPSDIDGLVQQQKVCLTSYPEAHVYPELVEMMRNGKAGALAEAFRNAKIISSPEENSANEAFLQQLGDNRRAEKNAPTERMGRLRRPNRQLLSALPEVA